MSEMGRIADILRHSAHVRFTPNSDRKYGHSQCRLCAMCGRLRVGKDVLHVVEVRKVTARPFGLASRLHRNTFITSPVGNTAPPTVIRTYLNLTVADRDASSCRPRDGRSEERR